MSQSDAPTQASSPGVISAASGSSSYTLPGLSSSSASQPPQPPSVLQPSTELQAHSLFEEQAGPSMATPVPEDTCLSRPTRSRQLPMRFCDELPVPPLPIPQPPPSTLPRVILHVFDSFRTSLNQFGIGREYHH